MATRSTGLRVADALTAAEAARCTRMSMLVVTGLPDAAGNRAAVASRRLPGPSIRMMSEGRPASWAWLACSIPPCPIRSPARWGAPSALAWAAVAVTTLPVSSEIEPDSWIAWSELSMVPSAASTGARAGQAALSTNRSPARSPG